MKKMTTISSEVVSEITCDRCKQGFGRDSLEWSEITSIDFTGGYGSILGDGMRISIDLCQHCLKETLGQWLRVEEPPPVQYDEMSSIDLVAAVEEMKRIAIARGVAEGVDVEAIIAARCDGADETLLGECADEIRRSADRASAGIDDVVAFVAASNKRIDALEKKET